MGIGELFAGVALVAVAALIALIARPWRVEATLKATTSASAVSLAGGLEVARLSASAAAILGGPGVIAVHLRARELWRRPITRVSVEAILTWIDERLSKPAAPETTLGRLARRAKTWLLARTDLTDLPELGLRVLFGLQDVSLKGSLTCGFSDPALTGKAAAWLFPVAGVLAPFGLLEVDLDWSGRTRIDGSIEVSFRFVPARVALEGLRFAWHHVHLRGPRALVSSTLPRLPALPAITTR